MAMTAPLAPVWAAERQLTSLARLGKLDDIATDSAEGVDHKIASATFCDMGGYRLRRDGIPALLVKKKRKIVVAREEECSLGKI